MDDAVASLRRAIDLNPSFPVAYNQMVSALIRVGRPREAVDWIKPLDRISPNDPFRGYYCCVRSLAWFFPNDDAAAIENAETSLAAHLRWFDSELVLAAASQRAGDVQKARDAGRRLVEARGVLTPEQLRNVMRLKREADFNEIVTQLRKVGFVSA